jgi:hypothetical protein
VEITLTSRVLAAYQFAVQYLGEPISIADIRLGLGGVGDCGPETLYPLLRSLHGTEVAFWAPDDADAGTGLFSVQEAAPGAPLYELEDSVEINGADCTHITVVPRG